MTDAIAVNLARITARLLLDPRGWRVDSLKSELGIADRTWRKYRGLLKAHIEDRIDPDGRITIEEVPEGTAKYIRLCTRGEDLEQVGNFRARLAAVWLTRKVFEFSGPGVFGDAIDDEWNELRSGFGDRRFWLGSHMLRNTDRLLHFVPEAPKDYSGHQETLTTLLHALFHRRRVRFSYPKGESGDTKKVVVCPLTLVMWRSALYLVAPYRPEKKAYVWSIDRMTEVELYKGRFEYPPTADYHPERLFDGSFGIWQDPDGKPKEFELVFAPKPWLHRYLRERLWHRSQAFEELDDGRLKMTFTLTSSVEVYPWIRSFGEDVALVRPDTAAARKAAAAGPASEARTPRADATIPGDG